MRLLITGFGPFHTHRTNPSEELMKLVVQKQREGIEVVGEVLPVVFSRIRDCLEEVHKRHDLASFDAILFCGLAASRDKVTPEKVALNWVYSKERADNEGVSFHRGERIDAGVENALFSSFPVEDFANFLNKHGIESAVSFSAGTYVCNSTFFQGLRKLGALNSSHTPCTFLHIPKDCDVENLSSLIIEFLLFHKEFKIKV
jgi:pyroglutamyl-peptidase